ncbi:hypothetical protein MOO46_05180 [Apilactobacillus apisilvae]|uniref:Extracellular protein n=1 Tax=Apilactobacillus apisilvae TaxID=2923364 RepID=A0ABY4PGM3_9LACO|nr:hypothetical protein [Apilactobacillus apisilvae]UQS84643.1 hypothetical protein MOO46_05180 [Apilactobacillus apisilvae]
MKKYYRLLLLSLSFITLLFTFQSFNAHASHLKYLNKFPNEIKGTWYTYTNDSGLSKHKKIEKMVVNKKTFNFHPYRKHDVIEGANLTKKQENELNKTSRWSYAMEFNYKGHKWFNFMGWQQGAGDGSFFNIHNFDGHKVLMSAGGAGISVDGQYYKSKTLAKKFSNKRFKGFNYYDNY